MHRCLLLLFVGMACTTSSVVASQSWKRALPLPEASQEAVTAANAVINQSGSEECLRGKFSNAILRLSNSCDVSGHSSTACELASEIAGQESELSTGDMIATSETMLDLLGDSETSHWSPLFLRWTSPIPVPSHSTLINSVFSRRFAARWIPESPTCD